MRVLLGVDQAERVEELAGWIEQFQFGELVQEWMSVVPSQVKTVWSLEPLFAAEAAARSADKLAGQREHQLQEAASSRGEAVRVRVRIGHPVTELLNRADETQADLITTLASDKTTLTAFFLGSVARGVVEGASQSVLLTRGSAPARPLKLLVASDHSEYAEKALATLIGWAPKGIGQLTLLHVRPPAFKADMEQLAQEIAREAYGRAIRKPEEVTAAAAQALGAALNLPAASVTSRTASGSVSAAIEAALEETGADLLVLGARGHSLLERLTLGSVSFRAVISCPKSVLVLRA